ncbi:uncharacterized protein LOC110900574 [Helianthus annuus]|uniref:uncharacterized protein LOC110900574 n=1 Tax=Helianthus annuus TaxID=4232 RepID=UPI000B8F7142|nr:uncharacterized protein LOC110900574 [Helianthus annuus]
MAWQTIRSHDIEVSWKDFVWFAQCIPKHAFLVWLIMRKKLMTQDKMLVWNQVRRKSMNMMCCLLCYKNIDSHGHLFFECEYSAQVWCKVRSHADMENIPPIWNNILSDMLQRRSSKLIANVVAKLCVAAAAYYIWRERNKRLFHNHARPPDMLAQEIIATVRYKLMGMKFKTSAQVTRMLDKWNIHGDAVFSSVDSTCPMNR